MDKDIFGHKLRIEGTPGKYKVFLDERELRYATRVELEVAANGRPAEATITVLAGDIVVSVDGDIQVTAVPINTAKGKGPA